MKFLKKHTEIPLSLKYHIKTNDMNILFLDDRSSAVEQAENLLKSIGYNVLSCGNIYEANEKLEENKDVDCYVVDLNIPPDGLGHTRKDSILYPGWLWILDKVITPNKSKYDMSHKIPIIIYSEYINVFKQQFESKIELSHDEWEFYNKVTILKKTDDNPSLKLFEEICTFINSNNKHNNEKHEI